MPETAPTVGLVLMTNGAPERVARILAAVRPHVDEIVLGVDVDGDGDVADRCMGLADLIVELPVRTRPTPREASHAMVETVQPVLFRACTTDWIMALDSDEVPSPGLLSALPDLLAARRISSVSTVVRWLYPTSAEMISSPAWDELRRRFVRNVPGLWTSTGRTHSHLDITGERREAAVTVEHLDLLLNDPDGRAAKAARYETWNPGLEALGIRVNDVYRPEAAGPTLDTLPLDPADRAAVDVVTDGIPFPSPPPVPTRRATLDAADVRDADQSWGAGDDAAVDGQLVVLEHCAAVAPGAPATVVVAAQNTAGLSWPAGVATVIWGWRRPGQAALLTQGELPLSARVARGGTHLRSLPIPAPWGPARFEVELRLRVGRVIVGEAVRVPIEVADHAGEAVTRRQAGRVSPPAGRRTLRRPTVAVLRVLTVPDRPPSLAATPFDVVIDLVAPSVRVAAAAGARRLQAPVPIDAAAVELAYAACDTDWVLQLGSHETPSPELLVALSDLVRGEVAAWELPVQTPRGRRWEPRLIRNVAGVLRFEGSGAPTVLGHVAGADVPVLRRVPARRRLLARRAPTTHLPAAAVAGRRPHGGALPDADYVGTLRVLRMPRIVPAGGVRKVLVEVHNASSRPWRAGEASAPLIRLGFRWLQQDGGAVLEDRWLLTETIEPGATRLQFAWIRTPHAPGSHRLDIDVLHEHVRWFGCGETLDVEVTAVDELALRVRAPLLAHRAAILEREGLSA